MALIVAGRAAAQIPIATEVVNGASYISEGIAPGEIATVFGNNLTSATGINTATTLPLPLELLGCEVLVNGFPAPIFAVDNINGQEQINFQVPYEIAGESTATVQVVSNGLTGNMMSLRVMAAQPGVFTYMMGNNTYATVLHANYELAGTSSPAVPGEIVLIYCTGLGSVNPQPQDGLAGGSAITAFVPTVTIGGVTATVAYAGLAPGYVGLYQINVVMPGVANGYQEVIVTVEGAQSAVAMLPVE